jgi:hypothetical protein
MTKRRAKQAKKSVGTAASELQSVIDSAEELLESLRDQQGAAVDRLRENCRISTAEQQLQVAASMRNIDLPYLLATDRSKWLSGQRATSQHGASATA